jgi:hypothetical protein
MDNEDDGPNNGGFTELQLVLIFAAGVFLVSLFLFG